MYIIDDFIACDLINGALNNFVFNWNDNYICATG